MKTQVCIIGAGPAGLMLGHMLRAEGIDCQVLERQTPEYVLGRIRAGVLEYGTVDLMARLGLDARMRKEGMPHDGFGIAHKDYVIAFDCLKHTGKQVMVFGQTELTRDLMEACAERDLEVTYSAHDVALHDIETDTPHVTFTKDGEDHRIDCRIIVGCDGFHGPSRQAIPKSVGKEYLKEYPFGWLGILADVPPCDHVANYALHDNGFALASMRSPTRSRYYIDVPLSVQPEDWSDDQFWEELILRLGPVLGPKVTTGPSIEKSIAPLRSYVFAPMRHGSLMLCGDAAHIVPPTGAKGLNLAASDVHYAGEALIGFFQKQDADAISGYSERALARVWQAERFSWSMTRLLHSFPDDDPFVKAMRSAELDYLERSPAARAAIAENYVGLPI